VIFAFDFYMKISLGQKKLNLFYAINPSLMVGFAVGISRILILVVSSVYLDTEKLSKLDILRTFIHQVQLESSFTQDPLVLLLPGGLIFLPLPKPVPE